MSFIVILWIGVEKSLQAMIFEAVIFELFSENLPAMFRLTVDFTDFLAQYDY